SFKKTQFWKVGEIFLNRRVENDRSGLFGLASINTLPDNFHYSLHTGQVSQTTVLDDKELKPEYVKSKEKRIQLTDLGDRLVRKAIQRNRFFELSNLKKYLRTLKSISDFICGENNLPRITIELSGSKENIENLNSSQKLDIAGAVLEQVRICIQHGTTEYIGTKEFRPEAISVRVKDKTLKLIVDENGDKQQGKPMSNPGNQDLFLDLKTKDWYVYEENYGTSEEKFFVKYIDNIFDKLKKEFADIYLLRNARLFQIYRFSDGKAFEPDFVLFLRKKRNKTFAVYQLFVEPKGDHLLKTDQWKEEFLLEIENEYKLQVLTETDEYKLVGLPFFNKRFKQKAFEDAFSKAVTVKFN
ncbi:MAG: hypothetical protein KAS23_03185, partial [Anaerohalosphaera sp.]|nr:hypothetical protein [Anaerohalosphaera sp.]